ncbi:MAG: biotin/lipoyl-binding protein, partial [Planctomycetes bacterium]|nr:biotin/lipoyl-binding protein [Planctomycetota bacterium]
MVESSVTTEIRSSVVGSTKILSVVKSGSRIKKGDVVVELDSSALKEKQLQQQIGVTQAQASLMQANTKVEAVKSQGAAEKLAAEKALEIANLAQKNWLTKGGEYEIRVQTARSEVAIAELQEQAAQAVLDRKKKAGDTNLDEAKLALAQAREARRPTEARYRLLTGYQRDFESAARELAVLKRQ